MIIDGHSHACGRYLTAENIFTTLNENSVDKAVLVPGELNSKSDVSLPNIASIFQHYNVVKLTNSLTKLVIKLTGKVKDIPAGNEYVYELKNKTDNRIIQFIWATTGIDNINNYLDSKYDNWAFHGVKLHQCWENFSIDSKFFKEVAIWTENHDLPLFIHLYSDRDVYKLIKYKKDHPNLKLIVAHLFGLEIFIENDMSDDNLYFDISPLQLISEKRLKMAIKYVGVSRIIMGTDTPYGAKDNLKRSISRIRNLDLTKDDKDLILGLNMKELLKL